MLILHATAPCRQDKVYLISQDAALLLRAGRIEQIGDSLTLAARYPNEPQLDARGMLVLPGFICAHARMSRILARGLALPGPDMVASGSEATEFWRRYAAALDYQAIRYSTLLAALEAMRYGTTLVVDFLSAPNAARYALDAVAEAALQSGLRVNASYIVSDRESVAAGRMAVDENVRYAVRTKDALLSASMGLDTCHNLSDTTLSYAVGAAALAKLGFHGIVGESMYAGRDCASSYGLTPTARLRRWGVLGKRTFLADGIYLDQPDRELLKRSGSWLVHVPRANVLAGTGLAPVLEYAAEGLPVGLGTDGLAYDMLAEAQAGFIGQLQARAKSQELTLAAYAAMLTRTNAALASALLAERVGVLEAGALADLVLLENHNPQPADEAMLQRQLILGSSGLTVHTVLVDGKIRYQNGQYHNIDVEQVTAHAREVAAELFRRI